MRTACTLSMALLIFAGTCPAGHWLSAELPDGKAPFAPVALFWFRVVRNPVVYRKVIDVPAVTGGRYLELVMDGEQDEALAYLDRQEVST